MIVKTIRFNVSLHSVVKNFGKTRNLLVHHGFMGSSLNFNSHTSTSAFSSLVNSHLIDARNHGTPSIMKAIALTPKLILSQTSLMTYTNTYRLISCLTKIKDSH